MNNIKLHTYCEHCDGPVNGMRETSSGVCRDCEAADERAIHADDYCIVCWAELTESDGDNVCAACE